jgi:sugar-specific transcriptional regulator TrmB
MSLPDALETLGLAHIEALSYAFLAVNASCTGYRVARGIGKPTANVYRALETLERKGLVIQDRGTPPSYRALPPDDMLARLESEFMERKASAVRELAVLQRQSEDEKVYALKSNDQLLARAHVVLAAARRIVLAEAPSAWTSALVDAIDDARSRNVRVQILTDGELGKPHDDTIARSHHALATIRFVADARESVVASLPNDAGGVREAIWTRSPLIGRLLHDALAAEVLYALIESGLEGGLSVDEAEAAFDRARKIREGI